MDGKADIELEKIREKTEKFLKSLSKGMYEREEAIKLSLLALMSGESIFFLGPPGVAKSLIARRIKYVLKDSKNFEYLMGRFSTPEEIFGPISISKLKNEDKYERITEGYLPTADIAFLDEIWKASPAIQNTLLTIINERLFRNGTKEEKVPLKLLVAASNELPPKGEGLEALWDRFIIRLYVGPITERENFEKMLEDSNDPYEDPIPNEDKLNEEKYKEWQDKSKDVKVRKVVFNVIDSIRKRIDLRNKENPEKEPIYVSDRRWKKIVKILKMSAFLNGRDEVDLADALLISYMIWNNKEEIKEVKTLVNKTIAEYGYRVEISLKEISEEIYSFRREVEKEIDNSLKKVPAELKKYSFNENGEYYCIRVNKKNSPIYIKVEDYDNLPKEQWSSIKVYNPKKADWGNSDFLEVEISKEEDPYLELKYKKDDYYNREPEWFRGEIEVSETKYVLKRTNLDEWQKKQRGMREKLEGLRKKIKEKLDLLDESRKKLGENLFINIEENLDYLIPEFRKIKRELRKMDRELDIVEAKLDEIEEDLQDE